MSEKLKESLSAVIDGEADEFELRRVLDEIGRDESLASSWERYHVIGSVLRGERTVSGFGMRERIWAELMADPESEAIVEQVAEVSLPETPAQTRPVARSWAPYAVAASVIAALLVGFIGSFELEPAVNPALAESDGGVIASQEALYQSAALKSEITDSDHNRTEAYIVRHYQQIGMDRPGLGFARMVAYERD
jgi:sigma-E factor negative regulatory protein RseA